MSSSVFCMCVMCLLSSRKNAAIDNLLMDETAETGFPCSVGASIPLTAMGDEPLLGL